MPDIRPIALPVTGLAEMRAEAHAEGVTFIDRLAEEYASGVNRFDGPGEQLCGAFSPDGDPLASPGILMAVAGLTRDPFVDDPGIGRIRRVYVRPAWRHRGLATALVLHLLAAARASFHSVRLRAETPYAAGLYENLGFLPLSDPEATHILPLHAATRP